MEDDRTTVAWEHDSDRHFVVRALVPGGRRYTREQVEALLMDAPLPRYLDRLPAMREAARRHGYALAMHGSGHRDCDLIAAPWTIEASDPRTLIEALRVACDGVIVGAFEGDLSELEPYGDYTQRNPCPKPHGRFAWAIQIGNGLYFDVSVMPRNGQPAARADIPPHEKYPMCDPQPVQLDCRCSRCWFHADGECHNVAPAITLNDFVNQHWTCHSREDRADA